MRKLATIRIIQKIEPIVGKDRVEMATVDGWTCMVSKADGFTVGTKCIFCEPDSVFPEIKQWEFLKKYNYRIKTQKFKDGNKQTIYSQGLVLPLNVLSKVVNLEIGDDVTSQLGITQYEPTMDIEVQKTPSKHYPQWLMRFKWFRRIVCGPKALQKFPNFVSKTDEERVQNCYQLSQSEPYWIATEKVDGQSGTFVIEKNHKLLGPKYRYTVCSRNYVNNDPNSSYNIVFNKYNLRDVLRKLIEEYKYEWVAIQGECVGPAIQGNKYKFEAHDLYVFNLIFPYGRVDTLLMKKVMDTYSVKCVPILNEKVSLMGKTCEEILKGANGESVLCEGQLREGIVYRSLDGKKSFKAVSPAFLVKYES